MKKNFITAFIILILTSLVFSSCGKVPRYSRFDVSNYVSYLETPPEYTLGDVLPRNFEFQYISKKEMKNLNKLITKDGNYIWLKIQFIVPEDLRNKEIGLYIGYIRGADVLWINNTAIRQYGEFPPRQNSSGFTAQYFMFTDSMLKQDGLNTILIQVWPDAFASIASKIFISEKPDIFKSAESMTFFNSKITMAFAGVMMVIFFMYLFLFFIMNKDENKFVYLFFSLLNLCTVTFLLPFFISEISWAKPVWLSYNWLIKLFFYGGSLATCYFANSFVITYLRKKDSKAITITRLIMFLFPLIWTFTLKSTKELSSFSPILVLLNTLQFSFSIPLLVQALIKSET